MNVLSLFSGIEGLGLGLERAGMKVVGQVEKDPFCRKVLERNYPEVPRHDDVRTCVEWWRSAVRPPVDLIAGGFPCQPFSSLGLNLGIGDERWGWPWMRDVVDALRPRFVLVENVDELLRRHAEAFRIVLGDLSNLGFDAEWSVVSACSVGAPHVRDRVFVLAYPTGLGLGQCGRIQWAPNSDSERHIHHWAAEPEPRRVADGVPRRMDRNRTLGNAVVPQVAEVVGRMIVDFESRAA